jgi:hypothetical protein
MDSLQKMFIDNGKIINTIHLLLVGPYLAILGYFLHKNVDSYKEHGDLLRKAVISLMIVGATVFCYHLYLLLSKNSLI